MEMLELEPAKHWLLPFSWSRAHEGMDGVSLGCFSVGASKQI